MVRLVAVSASLVAVLALNLPGGSGTSPLTHDPCPDAPAAWIFATVPGDLENLHFHDGALYTTGEDGLLRRFSPDGAATVVANLGARSGAMVTGTDGALYVRVGGSEVWRFGTPVDGSHSVYASGLTGANGLAVDAPGNLYVSDEAGNRIYRVPAADPSASAVWAELDSPNGLVVDAAGETLYVALTTDGRSTIAAIALDDPTDIRDAANLSFGFLSLNFFSSPPQPGVHEPSDPSNPVVPKGLDDLTIGPDGRIYAAAWLTGEIIRLDLAAGDACAIASGIEQPSSVRVAAGFGAHTGHLFVTDFGGPIELIDGNQFPGSGHVVVVPVGL